MLVYVMWIIGAGFALALSAIIALTVISIIFRMVEGCWPWRILDADECDDECDCDCHDCDCDD